MAEAAFLFPPILAHEGRHTLMFRPQSLKVKPSHVKHLFHASYLLKQAILQRAGPLVALGFVRGSLELAS